MEKDGTFFFVCVCVCLVKVFHIYQILSVLSTLWWINISNGTWIIYWRCIPVFNFGNFNCYVSLWKGPCLYLKHHNIYNFVKTLAFKKTSPFSDPGKLLTTCCRGEGQIELHQMVAESKTEMVVVKKLDCGLNCFFFQFYFHHYFWEMIWHDLIWLIFCEMGWNHQLGNFQWHVSMWTDTSLPVSGNYCWNEVQGIRKIP